MENAVVKKRNDRGWAIIIASVMILFTCGFLTGLVGADYPMHEEIAMDLHPRQPIAMFKAHPEPLWHLMVYTLVRFLHFEVEIAGAAVSGFLVVVTYLIAYFAIRKTVPGLQSYEAAGLDLVLHLCSAIYVPFFNIKPYLGQGTPNIWHNPTTICVRPIALLTLLLVASMCMEVREAEFEKGIPVGKAILTAILLILSCLAKPSFVQVFYPAIFTLMVIWLIMFKGKNLKVAFQLLAVCIPSLLVMILQFVSAFYSTNDGSEGIQIAPFAVAGARTPSIPISMILVCAFPFLMLIITAIKKEFTWGDALAWLMYLWGLIWRLFLAEKGDRMYDGNFSWGYMLAIYLVWYMAMKNYLKFYFSEQMTGNKRGVGFILATILLAAHLLSGLYYIFYMVVLGYAM